MPNITRFAPSPTGRLHLGHAHAACEVFKFAEASKGLALLRIEDIDHTRCRPEYTHGIYEDLLWLGYSWPTPDRVQSEHYSDYAKVVTDLVQRGLAYPCVLSRSDLKAGKRTIRPNSPSHAEAGRVSDRLRKSVRLKTPSLPFSVRLDLKAALRRTPAKLPYFEQGVLRQALPDLHAWAASDHPDPIIARKDIGASYHIAVTHDDHLQGVTHIVRGEDFLNQTPLHILIQNLMGWTTPHYHHHALVTDETGRKLSKSDKDITIQSLRESGIKPADVLSRARGAL
ncbi:MAG: tRNA glutamyl-Q(34) synthetase GluQRS [Litorimonas sp.]